MTVLNQFTHHKNGNFTGKSFFFFLFFFLSSHMYPHVSESRTPCCQSQLTIYKSKCTRAAVKEDFQPWLTWYWPEGHKHPTTPPSATPPATCRLTVTDKDRQPARRMRRVAGSAATSRLNLLSDFLGKNPDRKRWDGWEGGGIRQPNERGRREGGKNRGKLEKTAEGVNNSCRQYDFFM